MRFATVLLVGLGLMASGPFALAQPSTGPAAVAPRAQSATGGPQSPAFEYLGTLLAETGTRTVVENGPQGTRTIASEDEPADVPAASRLHDVRGQAEAAHILEALRKHGNNRLRAAAELGISRMTLYNKLHRYGLFGADG